jgi:hypothetical protein
MSGQGPSHMQPDLLLPGFGLGDSVVLRPSRGNRTFGHPISTTTTTTTTTTRWHQPGALRGGGIT